MRGVITPVDLYAEPAAGNAVEENALRSARKEVQIIDFLWKHRGRRFGTQHIADALGIHPATTYSALRRLREDEIIRKAGTGGIGGAWQWWME